ncbi:helix-turn-helix domain-containing protein [Streptomyces flaveus]|uniref:helix-turn-helix domain-containing protein n=1 Tax=Streptomyces flaveus TaxID=66370 RepID=UPI00331C04F5
MDEQAGQTRERHPRAAIAEFALKGHHGTPAEAIAKRSGVTQPRLFRLIPGKKAIVAALTRSAEDARPAFERAAKTLQTQMQVYAVTATADARGDDQLGEHPARLDETPGNHALPLSAGADKTTTFPAPGCSSIPLRSPGIAPSTGEQGPAVRLMPGLAGRPAGVHTRCSFRPQ